MTTKQHGCLPTMEHAIFLFPLVHHLHDASQAQLEAQVPPHAYDDDFAVEAATFEQLVDALPLAHCWPSVLPTRQRRRSGHAVCTRALMTNLQLVPSASVADQAGRFAPESLSRRTALTRSTSEWHRARRRQNRSCGNR